MPRFPPKDKRFTIECRVRGASKAYKKKRLGTVKTITHIGEGAKRRRRIEVEWDDMTREVVLSNAIEIIGEGEGFIDGDTDSDGDGHMAINGGLNLDGDAYGIFPNDGNLLGLPNVTTSNSQHSITHNIPRPHINHKVSCVPFQFFSMLTDKQRCF